MVSYADVCHNVPHAQSAITRDNVQINIDGILYVKVCGMLFAVRLWCSVHLALQPLFCSRVLSEASMSQLN